MRFFIDSADRAAVGELLATGLFAGVTTNPAILARAGLGARDVPDFVAWALDQGARSVFAQSWGDSAAALEDRGESLRAMSDRVVVKVPYSPHGLVAARRLARGGDVLVTALHSAAQAPMVATTDAAYLALFVARIDAVGRDGIGETISAHCALRAVGAPTRVMAGSLRTPDQVLSLAAAGIGDVTMGPAVWASFFDDPHTEKAVHEFERLAAEAA